MIVLVIGAPAQVLHRLNASAPPGMRLVDTVAASPDWIVVATLEQRASAIEEHGMTPFRVVEFPAIAAHGAAAEADRDFHDFLERLAAVGPERPRVSPLAVALVRRLIRPWIDVEPSDVPAMPESPETGVFTSNVPGRIPAGARLDGQLVNRDRDRARRFCARAVQSTADSTS
jgi:hypothetical protein